LENRQAIERAIEAGSGGCYLRLTPEQYARLRMPWPPILSAMPRQPKIHEPDSGDEIEKLAWAIWCWLRGKLQNADLAVVLTNLLVVAVGIVAAVIYGVQLHTMNGQLNEMRGSSTQTDQLLRLYREQLGQLTKQASDTHDLAEAARVQSSAAKSIAELTGKQVTSYLQLIESQRASISVAFGKVLNPVTFHEGAPSMAFTILLRNAGYIEATNVAIRIDRYFSPWGGNLEALRRQRDFCAIRPVVEASERWFDQNGKSMDGKGLRDETFTVQAKTEHEAQLSFAMSKPTDAEIIKWPPPRDRSADTEVTDRILPIVVGCVDYQSGAMPVRHQTGFIFEVHQVSTVDPGLPTLIHNGIDVPIEKVWVIQLPFGQGKKY
jgi:hypothetical protein